MGGPARGRGRAARQHPRAGRPDPRAVHAHAAGDDRAAAARPRRRGVASPERGARPGQPRRAPRVPPLGGGGRRDVRRARWPDRRRTRQGPLHAPPEGDRADRRARPGAGRLSVRRAPARDGRAREPAGAGHRAPERRRADRRGARLHPAHRREDRSNAPMKLALPNIALKRGSVEELAAAVAGYGADAVQWFQGLAAGVPDAETSRRVRRACQAHGIAVDHVGAYVNPVGLGPEQRRAGVAHLTGFCRVAKELGVTTLATFSGTVSEGTALQWNPETHSEASYATFVETMRRVMPVAEAEGVTIAIEPFVVTVVKDPDTFLRAFRNVGSPNLKLAMDVVNFYWPDDINQPRSNELMTEGFEKTRDNIA